MAKKARYRWHGFGEPADQRPSRVRSRRTRRRGSPGITNRQASFLADLERQLGLPYTGNSGLTRHEASKRIDELLQQRKQ